MNENSVNWDSMIDKIQKFDEAQKNKGGMKLDERFFNIVFPKDKTETKKIIHFLPNKDYTKLPFVKIMKHSFKGPLGRFYSELCPTMVNQKCPACESNTVLWNTGSESNKNIARDRKRKVTYCANILVVKDPVVPENDGKIFMFRFGVKLLDIIMKVMNPAQDDELGEKKEAINIFNPTKSPDFILAVKKLNFNTGSGQYNNYDASVFKPELVSVEFDKEKLYDVSELVDASLIKSYDELKEKLIRSGVDATKSAPVAAAPESEETVGAPGDDDVPPSDATDDTSDDQAFMAKIRAGK